jgi:DNA-directed RNA polymerase specialized sigma24 family protein
MYNTSLRIVNNTGDAEDVVQEAFTDAFRSLEDFHYKSTFGAWLKRIVINKSINYLRRRKNSPPPAEKKGFLRLKCNIGEKTVYLYIGSRLELNFALAPGKDLRPAPQVRPSVGLFAFGLRPFVTLRLPAANDNIR